MADDRTLQLFTCSKCGQPKQSDEMARTDQRSTGLSSWCRVCKNAVNRQWYERNKERSAAVSRAYYQANKEARRLSSKLYQQANSERLSTAARTGHLRRRFGLTSADYQKLWEQQQGVCGICHFPETDVDRQSGKVRLLAVDHDHKTGLVRGLLCRRCNTALGLFEDDPERLNSCIEYLTGTS